MNKKIKFKLNYVSNFRPAIRRRLKSGVKVASSYVKKTRIVCRNFLLFFIYMRYNSKFHFFKNISFFIKPRYFNTITVLRAPYRYKLGRYQFTIWRFFFLIIFSINLKKSLKIKKIEQLFIFLKILKSFYPWFDSNISHQHKTILLLPFFFNTNFVLKNYK